MYLLPGGPITSELGQVRDCHDGVNTGLGLVLRAPPMHTDSKPRGGAMAMLAESLEIRAPPRTDGPRATQQQKQQQQQTTCTDCVSLASFSPSFRDGGLLCMRVYHWLAEAFQKEEPPFRGRVRLEGLPRAHPPRALACIQLPPRGGSAEVRHGAGAAGARRDPSTAGD